MFSALLSTNKSDLKFLTSADVQLSLCIKQAIKGNHINFEEMRMTLITFENYLTLRGKVRILRSLVSLGLIKLTMLSTEVQR